jgi:hypothetical protein
MPRCDDEPDKAGEHDQRHDPGLQDLDVVADRRATADAADKG